MSYFSLFKEVILPLSSAILGAFAGSLSTIYLNKRRNEFDSLKEEIDSTNLLLAESTMQINQIFIYLSELKKQKEIFDEQRNIAIEYCKNIINTCPKVHFNKFIMDKIDPNEIKLLAKNSSLNIRCLYFSSLLATKLRYIVFFEDELNRSLDKLIGLTTSNNINEREMALKTIFGIEFNGRVDNQIESLYLNLIQTLELSVLIIETIIFETIKTKQDFLNSLSSSKIKKLPKLIKIKLDEMKKNRYYPKIEDYIKILDSI